MDAPLHSEEVLAEAARVSALYDKMGATWHAALNHGKWAHDLGITAVDASDPKKLVRLSYGIEVAKALGSGCTVSGQKLDAEHFALCRLVFNKWKVNGQELLIGDCGDTFKSLFMAGCIPPKFDPVDEPDRWHAVYARMPGWLLPMRPLRVGPGYWWDWDNKYTPASVGWVYLDLDRYPALHPGAQPAAAAASRTSPMCPPLRGPSRGSSWRMAATSHSLTS